jgi:hypothetical protein
VSLTAASLTIGENGAVVAIENAFDKEEGALFVYERLCSIGGEDVVKRESFRLFLALLLAEVYLFVLGVHFYHAHTT